MLFTLVVGYFAYAQYDVKTQVRYFACAQYDVLFLLHVILNAVKNPTEELTEHMLFTLVVGYFAYAQYDAKAHVGYFACAQYDVKARVGYFAYAQYDVKARVGYFAYAQYDVKRQVLSK